MSALFSLCKVELQAMLNAMHLTGSKKSRAFAAPLAAALGGGIMAYVGAVYALPMATVLLPMGMGDLYWGQMLLVGFCMALCFTMMAGSGMLFGGRDLDFLFALPIPARVILLAKMLALYLENLLFNSCLLIPSAVVYALNAPVGPAFWLEFVVICLCVPLLATAISAVFGCLSAWVAGHMRHKSLFSVLVSLLGLGLLFWLLWMLQSSLMDEVQADALRQSLWRTVPPLAWAARPLGGGNALSVVWFVLLSVGCVGVLTAAIAPVYQSLTLRLATRTVHRRFRMSRQTAGSAVSALYKKEAARFFGTPIYLLNCGLGPLFLLLGGGYLLLFPDKLQILLTIPGIRQQLPVMLAAMAAFFLLVASPSSVSISLEGRAIWLLQSAPVTPLAICHAKALFSLTICLPPMAVALAGVQRAFRLPAGQLAALGVCCAATALFASLCGLWCNLLLPRLDAPNDTVVVKQSASVLANMGIGFALLAVLALLWWLVKVSAALFLTGASVFVLALCGLMELALLRYGQDKFTELTTKG